MCMNLTGNEGSVFYLHCTNYKGRLEHLRFMENWNATRVCKNNNVYFKKTTGMCAIL